MDSTLAPPFSEPGKIGFNLGAAIAPVTIILFACFVRWRTGSYLTILSRLWTLFHGKASDSAPEIKRHLDIQAAVVQLSFVTGLRIRTVQQAMRLLALGRGMTRASPRFAAAGLFRCRIVEAAEVQAICSAFGNATATDRQAYVERTLTDQRRAGLFLVGLWAMWMYPLFKLLGYCGNANAMRERLRRKAVHKELSKAATGETMP